MVPELENVRTVIEPHGCLKGQKKGVRRISNALGAH